MKVLTIHFLHEEHFTGEEIASLKKILNVDAIIQVKADNQIEHAQYPIIDLVELWS